VHLVGFIIKKFVAMHGHRNVKSCGVRKVFTVQRQWIVVLFCVSFCIVIGGYQNFGHALACAQSVISSWSQQAPPKNW
jgi:Na+/H+ antiporter NhaD/arsenite permease-like protein